MKTMFTSRPIRPRKRSAARGSLLSLLLISLEFATAGAETPAVHGYYMDEPIFDAQVYVEEAGRQHPKSIVLVHGLGTRAARTWARLIPLLATDYHIVAVDLPGFGHSSKGNKLYSPDNYTRFLDYLVTRTVNTPYMLVGHSMGGNVAIDYAIQHPGRFQRLVLVDAAGVLHRFAYSQYLAHFGIAHIPEFYPAQRSDLRKFTSELLESLSLKSKWMSQAEATILENPTLRQSLLQGDPNTIAGYAMAMADYSGQLKQIKQPTLILWGEQDEVAPLRTGKLLARQLPNAALVTLANAGHSPMDDRPQQFATWLERFADADAQQLQTLLSEYAYTLPKIVSQTVSDSIRCDNRRGMHIRGHYRQVRITHCQDVTVSSLSARSLIVTDSTVTLENCRLQTPQTALQVSNSRLTITACQIHGEPAMALKDSELDIAGSQLSGGNYAIREQDNDASAHHGSRIVFSVSHVNSRYLDKSLHGAMELQPGEGL
jgi:pimeloyl-ACP methyl ester carboxylesterase